MTTTLSAPLPTDIPDAYKGFYEGRGFRGLGNRLTRLRGWWPDSELALHDLRERRWLNEQDRAAFAAGRLRLPIRGNYQHRCVLVSMPDDVQHTSVVWIDAALAPAVAHLAAIRLYTEEACQGNDEDDAYLVFRSCRAARTVAAGLELGGVPASRVRQAVEFPSSDVAQAVEVIQGLAPLRPVIW
jgi:hypothetical protein